MAIRRYPNPTMSDPHPGKDAGYHPGEPAAPHDAGVDADHAHGHDDGHGHEETPLGGIDWRMWGAGVLGVAAGLVVVAAFVMGTAGLG